MDTLKNWTSEVKEFNKEFSKKLNQESNHKDLFYGFEVFDGKIIDKPLILYIGINPGKGNGLKNRDIFTTERLSYLDLFEGNYRYHLAEKTIKFLRAIWSEEKIKRVWKNETMKTNFYHLATDNLSDLNTVLNDIKYSKEYFKKSAEFNLRLIKLLKPAIVILEGKTVFDFIVGECYEKKAWNTEHKYGYFYDDVNKIHLLGHSRERGYSAEYYNYFSIKVKEILD